MRISRAPETGEAAAGDPETAGDPVTGHPATDDPTAGDDLVDESLLPVAAALRRYAAAVSPLPPEGFDERTVARLLTTPHPGPIGALVAALRAGSPRAIPHAVLGLLRGAIPPRGVSGRWSGPGPS